MLLNIIIFILTEIVLQLLVNIIANYICHNFKLRK